MKYQIPKGANHFISMKIFEASYNSKGFYAENITANFQCETRPSPTDLSSNYEKTATTYWKLIKTAQVAPQLVSTVVT